MRNITLVLAAVLLLITAASPALPICCTPHHPGYRIDLIAAQHYDVGDIYASIVEDQGVYYLSVTYSLTTNFNVFLAETQLEVVCDDPSNIPQTEDGNPVIGHFTYQTEHDPTSTREFTYLVPLNQFSDCDTRVLYIAAHSVVVLVNEWGEIIRDETGWGDCVGLCCFEFEGDEWGTYFAFGLLE
jgi:hypothetical protein